MLNLCLFTHGGDSPPPIFVSLRICSYMWPLVLPSLCAYVWFVSLYYWIGYMPVKFFGLSIYIYTFYMSHSNPAPTGRSFGKVSKYIVPPLVFMIDISNRMSDTNDLGPYMYFWVGWRQNTFTLLKLCHSVVRWHLSCFYFYTFIMYFCTFYILWINPNNLCFYAVTHVAAKFLSFSLYMLIGIRWA